MKNILLTGLVLFSSCLLFASCEKELPEDAVFDPRYPETEAIVEKANDVLKEADKIFMRSNYLVELYLKTASEKRIVQVPNFEQVPADLAAVYNIIRNKEGNVLYVAEFPYSESGDWENIYESIYDDKGDLLLFVRKSSFLHEGVVVYEKSSYYYNEKHRLVKKEYLIKYGSASVLPQGVTVEFNYRFPYEKFKTRKKWLKAHGLKK